MQHNLSKLNRDLEGLSSLKILEWAYGEFASKIVASSSFQLAGWSPKQDLHDGLAELLDSFKNIS